MSPDPTTTAEDSEIAPRAVSRRGLLARVGGAILVAGLLLQPTSALSQGGRPPPNRPAPSAPAPVSGKVNVELMVVHGTDAHNRIDASLKPIMQHLRFMPHTGYTLLSQADHDINQGGHHGFPVEGGRRVDVKLISLDGRQAKIRVEFYQGKVKKMETVLAIHRNKAFVIVGPKHDNGELILAITPRY